MPLLDEPQAQPLLNDAVVHPADVAACTQQLQTFVQRYLPCFARAEQRQHAQVLLQGKLTGLQRKTTEPIAHQADLKRRPLQRFVGAGQWDDADVRTELRRHAREELGDANATYVLDGSGFPKKGQASCGVSRQWCGCLGKVDNCQVGVFVASVAPRGRALVDAQLYLPPDWAADPKRRQATYVPTEVAFAEKWRLALDLLQQVRQDLPGRWVAGDDEFGRCTELRAQLRAWELRYVLDVPCDTLVREVGERRPPSRPGGVERVALFERVDRWAARQPKGRWRRVKVRDGEKGPIEVEVLLATVQTKDADGRVGGQERVAVLRVPGSPKEVWYTLSNDREASRGELARVHGDRHGVEELLQQGKQEVGLSHYEVRSWTGWHHHVTLSLLALWFLQLERLRLGKKRQR